MVMSILSAIRFAFHRPSSPISDAELDRFEREMDRKIVMRFSSGNIRLRRGKYVTQDDVDKEYERIKTLNFG